MTAMVWGFFVFFCNKALIRCSAIDHCPEPNLHHNNVPCVQSYKHLTKCTFNILNTQKKTKKPRSILLQEITSLIFSVTDSRKGAT